VAVRQTEYEYLYVLGAVCPETGQTAGLLSPQIHAEMMNVFLRQWAQELPADVHAVLVWDQAGYHTAKHLRVPENVTILYLPPYSPELNPVENLWHHLRSHEWSNGFYKSYDALRQAACDAWQKHCLDPQLIRSVCNAPYATLRKTQT
jgi:transposase